MSIQSAIDSLTGKTSRNIEEAIHNIDLGGGGSDTSNYKFLRFFLSNSSPCGFIKDQPGAMQFYTYDELYELYYNNVKIFVTCSNPSGGTFVNRVYHDESSSCFMAYLMSPAIDGDNVYLDISSIVLNSENECTVVSKSAQLV